MLNHDVSFKEKIKDILLNKKFMKMNKVSRSNVNKHFSVKKFSKIFENYLKNLGSL